MLQDSDHTIPKFQFQASFPSKADNSMYHTSKTFVDMLAET